MAERKKFVVYFRFVGAVTMVKLATGQTKANALKIAEDFAKLNSEKYERVDYHKDRITFKGNLDNPTQVAFRVTVIQEEE